MGDKWRGADRRTLTPCRLRKGGQRAAVMRLAGARRKKRRGDRGERRREGMRELGDLAVIVPRIGQMRRTVQAEDKLREHHHRRHGEGDAVPAPPQPT